LSIYPKGNGSGKGEYLSVFLLVVNPELQPKGWTQNVIVSCTMHSQIDEKCNIFRRSSFSKTFRENNKRIGDNWGSSNFAALSEIKDKSKGYIVDDTLVIMCHVQCEPMPAPTPLTEGGNRGDKHSGCTETRIRGVRGGECSAVVDFSRVVRGRDREALQQHEERHSLFCLSFPFTFFQFLSSF
jgi:hypothetical protein